MGNLTREDHEEDNNNDHVAGSHQLQGQDLVLLLDLAGHSLGLGSALQILALVDESFKDLCKPKLIENKVESCHLILFPISTMNKKTFNVVFLRILMKCIFAFLSTYLI